MLIDTHCHLDFKDFKDDMPLVIERAKKDGIEAIINVGSSVAGTKKSIELASEFDIIYAAAGIHPHDADITSEKDLSVFRDHLEEGKRKIVAIGEIGLDYYKNRSRKENQKRLFIALLEEAKKRDLPIIIHNRDAHQDTISILKGVLGSSIKGVMHCFSGDKDFLKVCLDLGMYISFTCNLTFKNAEMLREVAKLVPMDRLLLETDSPFLAPQVFRGKRNEPAYIVHLARLIAEIKGIEFEETARETTYNAKRLFKL
ncbi:MAG: TatD family hydrolase [Candidatus Omnitrophota bacterium]